MPREWCPPCHLSRTVIDASFEADNDGREYHVTTLACGHEIVHDA